MRKRFQLEIFVLLTLCFALLISGPVGASSNRLGDSAQNTVDLAQSNQGKTIVEPDCLECGKNITTLEDEAYWWQRWNACEWSTNRQINPVLNNTDQIQPSNNFIQTTFQYPISFDNSSSENLDKSENQEYGLLDLWGDHGPTPGQPADRWNPALPKFPNFEGHWFPKQSHSKLYFSTWANIGWNYLHIHIDRDQDHHTRWFYVWVDGNLVDSSIIGSSGFEDMVSFWATSSGYKEVQLEIYFGGHENHGWKLVYFWPYEVSEALHILGEYFPKMYRSPLEYRFEGGPNTKINIEIQRVNDPYSRYFSIYIDGDRKVQEIVSGTASFEFDLGSYPDWSMHEIKLEVRSGSYTEYGWRVTLCALHYESVFAEVDWMAGEPLCVGHKPPDSVLEYVEAYYKIHGYDRVEMYFDEEIDHAIRVLWDEFRNHYVPTYFDNYTELGWRYVLFGHLGQGLENGYCIGEESFIADAICGSEALRRGVLMHEFGHSVGIIERTEFGNEFYCWNQFCCMALAGAATITPWYCGFHWSLRQYPLWSAPD